MESMQRSDTVIGSVKIIPEGAEARLKKGVGDA